jgi:GrpB-like predicted nucleotidyltransferase (UPF0157 family)
LFNNPVGCLTSLAVFQAKALQNCGFSGSCSETEVSEQLLIKNEILDKINHHLYVCAKDNEELNRHILFRDYLNSHHEIKTEYNNIKKSIIEKYGNEDREKYVSIKETEYKWFFEKIIREAKREKMK